MSSLKLLWDVSQILFVYFILHFHFSQHFLLNLQCEDMYNYGKDKTGRPVVVLRVHTERDPHNEEQKLRFMIYSMERTIRYEC